MALVTTFASEDEAVRLANDTEFGLVGYVFTRYLTVRSASGSGWRPGWSG